MKPQSYEINVDTLKSISHSSMEFSQNNLNISELIFNITEDEKALPLNDTDKIIVYFKKPDKTVVFQDKEIEILDKAKGKIKVLLTTQTLVKAGDVQGEISIERVEDGTKKRANTYGFSFKVRSSIASNESIESTNEFQVFDKILKIGEKFEDFEEEDFEGIIEAGAKAETALVKATENTNQIGILSENITDVKKTADAAVSKTKDGRVNLVLTADATNFNESRSLIADRRGNTVTIRGAVVLNEAAVGNTITTLPVDMRPTFDISQTIVAIDGTPVSIDIITNGIIIFWVKGKSLYLSLTYVID
ncbi:TPA: BppU family phage baseplate upper protein [Bacillus paranthracis]